jgi:L-Ala-D/L-Glu epimerase
MQISSRRIELTKRVPLTISRGTITGATCVVVSVEADGFVGMGEMSPNEITGDTPEQCEASLAILAPLVVGLSPLDRGLVETLCHEHNIQSATRCALNQAMFDWLGKRAGLPLCRLWGLNRGAIPVTSVTIGINPPEVVEDRTIEVLVRLQAKVLKVKLGSPLGIEHDQAIIVAAQRAAHRLQLNPGWRVDANAGWSFADALTMAAWLADRGVTYIEQPLTTEQDEALSSLSKKSPLPIYVDESVHTISDVVRLAGSVAGVNLKLMKTGGIDEAFRLIHTAKAHGLRVMIGCMGESSLSIAAGAHLSALVDEVDLDSHFNLVNDPFVGLHYRNGVVTPGEQDGLGISYRPDRQETGGL